MKEKCPYCNEVLETKPTRKTKCPFCKNYIFVREGKLMKKDEADALAEKFKIKYKLEYFGLSETDYNSQKKKLADKFGSEPKYYDVMWSTLNAKTLELMKTRNFQRLSNLYYQMAFFLNEEGKNFFYVLQRSRKVELENTKAKKVKIMSAGGCPSCKKLDGKSFTVKEALDTMPIPNKNCSNIEYNNFCRCMYT